MEKSPITPNRNPTYNMHYFVDILVITIGIHPQIWLWDGFGVTCWGPNDPISEPSIVFMENEHHHQKTSRKIT